MTEVDDFLAHYGVKGMKWGRRKARNSEAESSDSEQPAKKKMDPATKMFIGQVIRSSALIAATIAVRKGARWAVQNPDKVAVFMQRAQNKMNGVKAIGVGYEVIRI